MSVRKRRIGFCIAGGVAVLVAAGVAWRAWLPNLPWLSTPQIKRNFAAEINVPIEKIPEDQRAWPRYRQAMIMFQGYSLSLHGSYFPVGPNWKRSESYLNGHQKALKALREASTYKHLGFYLRDAISAEDAPLVGKTPLRAPSENPLLMSVYLVSTQQLVRFAPLLSGDAILAARNKDGRRAVENVEALARMAEHAMTLPTLLSRMKAVDLQVLMFSVMGELLRRHSEVLTDEQLIRLEKTASSVHAGKLDPFLPFQRSVFLDILQRFYTDDGNGEGHPYPPAFREQNQAKGRLPGKDFIDPLIWQRLGGRQETLAAYDAVMNRAKKEFALPPWALTGWTVEQEMNPYLADKRYILMTQLFPALEEHYFREQYVVQLRDAMRTVVALVRWGRKHAAWPGRLEELIPDFLPELPIDRIDGKPLRYRVVGRAANLYSIGFDRDDDAGLDHPQLGSLDGYPVSPSSAAKTRVARWRQLLRSGARASSSDWVLWRSSSPWRSPKRK